MNTGRDPIDWPQRRRALAARAAYPSPETEQLNLDSIRAQHSPAIALAAKIISQGKRVSADPKSLVGQLEAVPTLSNVLARSAAEWGGVIGIAAVNVLRRMPSVKTWEFLWMLAWHSAALEHRLPEVVTECARTDKRCREIVINLAFKVVKKVDADPGRRAMPREKPTAEALRDRWATNGSLTDLWWGLREGGYLRFHDDDGMFQIIADLDTGVFIRLLSTLKNPYPVRAALESSGANWSFDRWESLISQAPIAFKSDGTWNGSVITPLLLSICWSCATDIRVSRDGADLAEVTEEVRVLVNRIAAAIASRQDAAPCSERFSTWLMRQCLTGLANEPRPFPADATSRGYVEATLISALGQQLAEHRWNTKSPPEAELWEPWCYRAVLITYATTNISKMPVAGTFISEWGMRPEDWSDAKGHQLREKASIFESFGQRADAYGSRLLAMPLVHDGDAIENWNCLWAATVAVREIIEFGSEDEGNVGAIGLQHSAGQLVRLAFGIGLMMMDFVADAKWAIEGNRQTVLNESFSHLSATAFEMRAVDQFDQGYWDTAVKHLAVRRLLWEAPNTDLAAHFDGDTRPRFVDFLADAEPEVENLLSLIEGCLRNGATQAVICEQLAIANIDLGRYVGFAERLRALDVRRSGIGDEQLKVAQSLLLPGADGLTPLVSP